MTTSTTTTTTTYLYYMMAGSQSVRQAETHRHIQEDWLIYYIYFPIYYLFLCEWAHLYHYLLISLFWKREFFSISKSCCFILENFVVVVLFFLFFYFLLLFLKQARYYILGYYFSNTKHMRVKISTFYFYVFMFLKNRKRVFF